MLVLLKRYELIIIKTLLFSLCPLTFFSSRIAIVPLVILGLLGFAINNKIFISTLKKTVCIWIFIFLGWMILSSLWSFVPLQSLKLGLRLLGITLLGVSWYSLNKSFKKEDLQGIKQWFFYGLIISCFLVVIDYFLGNPWQHFMQRTSAKAFVPLSLILSMGIWPSTIYLFERFKNIFYPFLFITFTIIVLFLIDCDTAVVALSSGIIISLLSLKYKKFLNKIGQVLCFILILISPLGINFFLTDQNIQEINKNGLHIYSHIHRLYIWQAIAEKIQNNVQDDFKSWLVGYGLDTSREELIGGIERQWPFIEKNGEKIFIKSKQIPIHPHNVILQWWLELGLIGAILGALVFQNILRYLNNNSLKLYYFNQIGLLSAIVFIALVNLGFWQNWWLAIIFLLSGIMVVPKDNELK